MQGLTFNIFMRMLENLFRTSLMVKLMVENSRTCIQDEDLMKKFK